MRILTSLSEASINDMNKNYRQLAVLVHQDKVRVGQFRCLDCFMKVLNRTMEQVGDEIRYLKFNSKTGVVLPGFIVFSKRCSLTNIALEQMEREKQERQGK